MPINYLPPSINVPIVAALTTTQYQITWDSSIIGWEQVYQFLLKTASPTVVYLIRDSELAPVLSIPTGIWELKNSLFETKQYGNPAVNAITVLDGAILRNLGAISKSCSLRFISSIPCLEIDPLAVDGAAWVDSTGTPV